MWAHSCKKKGRDGQGTHFRGRVSDLGAALRKREMKQQRRRGGTGSNSQMAADSVISWVCGLTGLSCGSAGLA